MTDPVLDRLLVAAARRDRDLAAAPGLLFSQDVPFDDAILIGAVETGEDLAAALARALAIAPVETVLGKSLSWFAENLPGSEPHSLVSGGVPAKPTKPPRDPDQALADRDPGTLSDAEQSRLWKGAHSAGQYEVALRLATWLAQHLIRAGDVARASGVAGGGFAGLDPV